MGRYSTCQKTISRKLEQMYIPSDTGLEWLGEGSLYKLVSNKCQGVQTAATLQVTSEFSPGALVQIWHPPDHKWET